MFKVFASKMDTTGLGLLVITLLSLASIGHAQFSTRPKNTVAISGGDIQLECEADTENSRNLLWSRSEGVDNFVDVAADGTILPGFERYSVQYDSGPPSRSVLTRTGVLPEDAGTFRCSHITGEAYAQVVVLDSEPQTAANASLDEMIEGESFFLSCSVGFRSAISWAPAMTWLEESIGTLPTTDQSSANEARHVYNSTTDRLHDGRVYQCSVEFLAIPEENIPDNIKDDHDMVPPSYSFSSATMQLAVFYPVEELNLGNQKEIYNPGESLTITANGRPQPLFSWKNLMDNTTLDDAVLRISAEMEGVQNWTYMAYNTIRGETYRLDDTHAFIVQIPTTTTTPPTPPSTISASTSDGGPGPTNGDTGGLSGGAIAGIVIGCLIGLALLILLIFCCISRNKAPKSTKEKANKTNHVDTIRNQPQMVMPPGDIAYIDKEKGPPPYNPYAPPSVKTDEGLVYADLAFEDKPRSRKPIQVYENTDYGEIL